MKRHNILVAIIAVVLLQFLVVAILQSRFKSDEPGAVYVALLFAIPPLLQVLGMFLVRRMLVRVFYSFIALLSSGSYLCCWVYYVKQPVVNYHIVWICLALTGVFVVIAFLIATAIFRDNNAVFTRTSFTRRLANGIGTSPAGELLFFLAFFISIGYLISFSLAFSDKYRITNGLLPGLRSDVSIDYDNNPQSEDPTPITPAKKWLIEFSPASATFEFDKTPLINSPERLSLRDDIKKHNTRVLNDIIDTLRSLENNQPIRITLIGRSDEASLFRNNQYTSNYELAEARANSVKFTIEDLLSKHTDKVWRNIEWLVLPLSESTSETTESTKQSRRSVEVSIQTLAFQVAPNSVAMMDGKQIRLLTLIEYVYFSMYTITTTGYGDIKPSTPFVMFVCTLTNLYEIFFLVIFFNVLLSPKARSLYKRKAVARSIDQLFEDSKLESFSPNETSKVNSSVGQSDIEQGESRLDEKLQFHNSVAKNASRSEKVGLLIFCFLFIRSLFKGKDN